MMQSNKTASYCKRSGSLQKPFFYQCGWILLLLIFCLLMVAPVTAAPAGQMLTSPTPNLDGNILYTVTQNDTCLSISLRMGIDVETIRQMNNLDVNCTLIAGEQISLGRVVTATPTAGPSPTPTPILPTSTLYNGNAELCIRLFDDINGNGMAEETERDIAGGAVSITKRGGMENFSGLTTGIDLLCFPEVPEGDYNISVAPPNEYNATTNMNYAIKIKAGDTVQVNFGSQKQAAFEEIKTTNEPATRRSPLLAIVGVGMMVAGLAIVVIFGILKRRD
jgi:hypothetical protein